MSLHAHLASGATHVCRAWAITRADGVQLGFSDHDRDISFEGITFRAGSGMGAMAVQQTTGLSVDNSETLGALSADAITAHDITAGRYDGAKIRAWLVRWDAVAERELQFQGRIGEIRKQGEGFSAELRGLTEALNVPRGRVFHRGCAAVLGDAGCRVDLSPGGPYCGEGLVTQTDPLRVSGLGEFAQGWFEQGALEVLEGAARGLRGQITADEGDDLRALQLAVPLAVPLQRGDRVRLLAGCDRHASTCRAKFANIENFQGFPHIPGEDWLMQVPRRDGANDGRSLFA